MIRVLALAGSMSAFVAPAATARMIDPPIRAENQQALHTQYQLPANFRTEVQSTAKPYTLPSGFHTDSQGQSKPATQPYNLPAGFKPEVQKPSSPVLASNPGAVVREIRTVTDDGSPTLAIVLASIALAIALCGSAYVWVRLTRMQRDFSSRALVS